MDYVGLMNRFRRMNKQGTGAPNGVVTADIGCIYHRKDGGAATSIYVKESGMGTNTGWVAK